MAKAASKAGEYPPADEILRVLDRGGIQTALVGGDGRVRWASEGLVRSRGEALIGGEARTHLFRRRRDAEACRREEVRETGEARRAWLPASRPGTEGPRQLLVQVRLPGGDVLDAFIDTDALEPTIPDHVFRERALSEGLRHVPAGVLLLDAEMRVSALNPSALRLLGRDEAELKGRPLAELLPPGTLPAEGRDLSRLLVVRGAIEEREIVLPHEDGARAALFNLAAVLAPDGTLAAATAVLTDITRERRLTEALERQVGHLTLLRAVGLALGRASRLDQVLRLFVAAAVHPSGLGLAAAGFFLVDEGRRTVRGRMARLAPSRRAANVRPVDGSGQELEAFAFGPVSSADRQLETTVRRFFVPLDDEDHPLVAALSSPGPCVFEAGGPEDRRPPLFASVAGRSRLVLAPLSNQGRRLGVLVAAVHPGQTIDDDRIALLGMVASTAAGAVARGRLHDELAGRLEDLRDANARLRNLQGQLLKAERLSAIGELAAEIVHQIRNPLSVVGGFARRLEKVCPPDDPRHEDLAIIIEEARRMEGILARIRQDVRLARSPAKEKVDPAGVVHDAVARYTDLAREEGVGLAAAAEPGLPAVRGSREILLEVLDNLLRNAFDAIGAGGHVSVTARRIKEAIHIVVEDDGPGIAPDCLERIFEPFFTTKVGGTGLGLPLSKKLVVQCGGALSADSRQGEGSRFRIVLPVWTADEARPRNDEGE